MSEPLPAHVSLSAPELSDAPALFALINANRDALRPWMPWEPLTRSEADSRAFLESAAVGRQIGKAYTWLVLRGGELAGVCDLHAIDALNGHAFVGYWLDSRQVGQGVMQAALRLLLAEAFGPLGLHRVAIDAAADNRRGCAVAERLGFRYEGVLREYLLLQGRYCDARQYSLLAHEWTC
ncbi:GNAT family N-acetyltransferase [Chromobacterium haemolyticum]|uniref:GNAT family N-acetyltransferase n=1 Tax=Chromobacterium haemolyticum TaxID=394935 RepID=UPI00405587EA